MAYSKCFSTSVIRVVLVFVLCACSLSAQSALIDRGEGFIYDDVLDVECTAAVVLCSTGLLGRPDGLGGWLQSDPFGVGDLADPGPD